MQAACQRPRGRGAVKSLTHPSGYRERIGDKFKDPLKDIKTLQLDVARLYGRLDLKEKAALRPLEFKQQLPEIASTLKRATELKSEASAADIDEVRAKFLSVSPTDPGYWLAASEFVTYRFAVLHQFQIPQITEACRHVSTSNSTAIQIEVHNCIADLDKPDAVYNGVTFINCIIKYSGGPLHLGHAQFKNCFFELRLPRAPETLDGRQLIASALSAENPRNFEMP